MAIRRNWYAALALFALLASACSGGDSTGPNGDGTGSPVENPGDNGGSGDNGGDNGGTQVPAELVGKWMHGTISPTNFWDDHTGQYMGNAYGMADYVTFGKDGRYEEFVYLYSQMYNCRTQIWTSKQGTVSVNGDEITFHLKKGKYQVADTCSQRNNYSRPMTADEVEKGDNKTWSWKFAPNEYSGDTYLYLGWDDSSEPMEYKPSE